MSIQFRSRIKSVIDYSKVLNGIGVCCDKNGNKSLKAFYDCFNDGGNYFPAESIDAVECPPADIEKGCCCACSFVGDVNLLPYPWDFTTDSPAQGTTPYYDSGVVCNMTRCECERLKGKFTVTDASQIILDASNIEKYCYKDAPEFGTNLRIDARYPRACCHIDRNPETGYPTDIVCENVCLNSECALLGNSVNPSVYDEKATCGFYLYKDQTGLCGSASCTSPLRLSQMVNKTKEYSSNIFGSCYELEKNTSGNLEYMCDIKPQSMCSGYWVQSEDILNPYCNDKYTPQNPVKINNLYDVQKISEYDFNNLNLKIGQKYQGGIYIGVYEPGDPINPKGSELFGDLNFNSPTMFYPTNVGIGGKHKKWAVIVDETPYRVPFLDDEPDNNYNTSLWDGYYNTYGDMTSFFGIRTKLTNTIKFKNRNGFIDYYIPSIYEMYFYWSYLIKYTKPTVFGDFITSSIFNTKYINSKTNKSKINNNSFVYGGELISNLRYRTLLIEKNQLATVLFFRKIVIET